MAEKKKNVKPIGKPNPFLYYLLAYVAGPIFRLVCRVKIDRSALQNIQGPAFFICPHISNIDFILVALALLPFGIDTGDRLKFENYEFSLL